MLRADSHVSLGHLLYVSDAVRPMSHHDLEAIRDVSISYNAEHGITGVLFYSKGHFVQLLEGDPAELRTLYERIERDARHHHVRLLVERPADHRVFADWEMGLLDLQQYTENERRLLDELVALAGGGDTATDRTPIELEILSRFCMLLPAT